MGFFDALSAYMDWSFFPVAFPLAAPWLGPIQFWFCFQTYVVLGMGIASFISPGSDPITLGGYWKDEKERSVLAPNARSWAVRSAFGGLMNILAMFFGTRECYAIMAACAAFRETVDCIQCVMEGGKMENPFSPASTSSPLNRAFTGYMIPAGKFPPMGGFFPPWAGGAAINFLFLYKILMA